MRSIKVVQYIEISICTCAFLEELRFLPFLNTEVLQTRKDLVVFVVVVCLGISVWSFVYFFCLVVVVFFSFPFPFFNFFFRYTVTSDRYSKTSIWGSVYSSRFGVVFLTQA